MENAENKKIPASQEDQIPEGQVNISQEEEEELKEEGVEIRED